MTNHMNTSTTTTRAARTTRWHRMIALPVVGLFALGAAACSESAESMTDDELRTELISVLTEDGTVTDTQASCVVDGLFEDAPREQINRMANAQEADEITDEDLEVLTEVMFDCL